MKYNKDIYILFGCLIIYALNQLFFKHIGVSFFNNYLNDLISVPLYFSFINIISINLRHKEINSFKILFCITLFLSFLGEYVSIFLIEGSVADIYDVICYFIGFIIYYVLKNIKN